MDMAGMIAIACGILGVAGVLYVFNFASRVSKMEASFIRKSLMDAVREDVEFSRDKIVVRLRNFSSIMRRFSLMLGAMSLLIAATCIALEMSNAPASFSTALLALFFIFFSASVGFRILDHMAVDIWIRISRLSD